MTIGGDLKEVFEEVGASFTIIRSSGNVSGEYLDSEPNTQVTKPFIREFFLEATFAHDTEALTGDILDIAAMSGKYMVMNKTPEVFENSVVAYNAVLYRCNVSGELTRFSGTGWDSQTYLKDQTWSTIKSLAYGLQTEALYGHSLEGDEELGLLGLQNHELYLPNSYDAKVHDRYQPYSGEYYRLETQKSRRFPSVDVFEIGEDHR